MEVHALSVGHCRADAVIGDHSPGNPKSYTHFRRLNIVVILIYQGITSFILTYSRVSREKEAHEMCPSGVHTYIQNRFIILSQLGPIMPIGV